jgi:predicted RecB family nuclease
MPAGPDPQLPTHLPRLSKSKFLSGLQCHKRLYFEIYAPELATPADDATQTAIDHGIEIGLLARRRFPGGVLVGEGYRQVMEALQRTQCLLGNSSVPVIFEAAFQHDDVLVRVDVLERVPSTEAETVAWRLIEVKSAARTKEVHLEDLAIQTYVLTGAGLRVAQSCLMHVSTDYLYRGGEIDVGRFFAIQDLTDAVRVRLPALPSRLAGLKRMLTQPAVPAITPGDRCHRPYLCPFWEHCTGDKSKRWIYYLPGNGQALQALAGQGIDAIDNIPAGFPLSMVQRRMKDNVEWISPRLKAALQTVRYPVCHLDFETFAPAIPKFPMTRPYQTIPIQWSNHIESPDGVLRHDEYLSFDPKDSREELAVTLLDSLGREGSICVYSGYERSILERLGDLLPLLRTDLQRLISRLWDLFPIIRDHYYHPAFAGSFSLKSVLPALVPSLGYDDLEIREGEAAARAYERMLFEVTDWVERLRIRDALLKYCARDTLALLELRKALAAKAWGMGAPA